MDMHGGGWLSWCITSPISDTACSGLPPQCSTFSSRAVVCNSRATINRSNTVLRLCTVCDNHMLQPLMVLSKSGIVLWFHVHWQALCYHNCGLALSRIFYVYRKFLHATISLADVNKYSDQNPDCSVITDNQKSFTDIVFKAWTMAV